MGRSKTKMKIVDSDNGLELWKIEIKDLREQDLNARYMKSEMFNRLVENIKKDNRLESFPFVAKTDLGFEIVSGHHRVRASIDAGITEIYCIVDVTGLNRDRIASKQLSHNSISGEDNDELVRRIYNGISDAEEKLRAYIDENFDKEVASASAKEITFDERYKIVTLTFSESDVEILNKALEEMAITDEVYINELESFEKVKQGLKVGAKGFNIRSTNTLMMYLMETIYDKLGLEMDSPVEVDEFENIGTLMGFGMIPKEYEKAIKERFKKYDYKSHERYKAFLDILGIEHD